jgi:hypothetical protein
VLWGVGGGVALATYVAVAAPGVRGRVPGVSRRGARAAFAVRVGAPVWFFTALGVFAYARRRERDRGGDDRG